MEPRDRILEKANALFMQYGIRSVSMDDIANGLGMSKKTLYQHFADKDALVAAVVELHVGEMQSRCGQCRHQAENAIHEIFITMDILVADLANMNPMVLFDLEKFHFASYQRFRQHKDSFLLGIIRQNLEWGVRDGLYRPDIDVDIMSKYRLESMMLPFNVALFPPGKYNLAATTNMILEHFVFGVSTLKGHELIQRYGEERNKK